MLFTTREDAVTVPVLAVPMLLVAAATAALWARRRDIVVRAKSAELVVLQTAAGWLWFVGFVVRNGHVDRPPDSVLALCSLWWFGVAMVLGFGLWASCVLVRLVRLRQAFIVGATSKLPWIALVLLMDAPFALFYGLVVPASGAVEYRPPQRMCLYTSRVWVAIDFAVVLAVFLVLLALVWQLRHVRDQLGENASVRRALVVSAGLYSTALAVQLLQIDDRWYGRALETGAIVGAVVCFFIVQAGEAVVPAASQRLKAELTTVAANLSDPDEESQDRDYVDEGVLPKPADGASSSGSSTRARQRIFSRSVLGD